MQFFKKKEPTTPKEPENSAILISHSNSARSRNLTNISLIIVREYKARVYKKGFIIGTVIMLILVALAACIPTVIELLSSDSQSKIGIANQAGRVAGQDAFLYFDTRLNTVIDSKGNVIPPDPSRKGEFQVKEIFAAQLEASRQQVRDGKLDILLEINRDTSEQLTFNYFSKGSATGLNALKLRSAATELNFLDRLSRLGIAQNQMMSLFEQPQFKVTSASEEKSGRTQAETLAAYFVSLGSVILIFTTIIQYGTTVAQGAVEEKSSRVMEIMINAATPFQLMMGKIIGIGLAGVTQIGLVALVGIGAFLAQPLLRSLLIPNATGGTIINVTGVSLTLLALAVVYFILGFLMYATLYAAIGSLVSRQEDVQAALTPLTFVFMGGYFASIFSLNAPETPWVAALSYVPFFSPMLMLTRVGLTDVAWWEVPLTIVIMLISIVVFTWLAARIYRAGVLMYGQKPTLGKLIKLVVSK